MIGAWDQVAQDLSVMLGNPLELEQVCSIIVWVNRDSQKVESFLVSVNNLLPNRRDNCPNKYTTWLNQFASPEAKIEVIIICNLIFWSKNVPCPVCIGPQVSLLWVSSVAADVLNSQMLWNKENRECQDKVIKIPRRG